MPGNSPNMVSGKPNLAPRSAIMTLNDNSDSKPPPSASPCANPIVIIGRPSVAMFRSRMRTQDFGAGYASLNYLRKFPFHKIKIDQSFISDLGDEHDARAIIGAVATLGAGLDKVVVAEGIETEEQMKLVTSQGCHEGQGFLFGRPMSGAAIRARLETPITLAQMVA